MFELKYIIEVDDADIGTIGLLYDIEYINSDWLFLSQRLDLQHLENGYYYYASNFELIDKYKNQNFSAYPKADKITLWQAIFGLKEYTFNTYSPDIVEHFVDATCASWEERLALYKKYLRPKGYVYVVDKKTNAFHLIKEHIYTRLKWGEYENFEL